MWNILWKQFDFFVYNWKKKKISKFPIGINKNTSLPNFQMYNIMDIKRDFFYRMYLERHDFNLVLFLLCQC